MPIPNASRTRRRPASATSRLRRSALLPAASLAALASTATVAPAAVEFTVTNLGQTEPGTIRPGRSEAVGDGGDVAGRGFVVTDAGTQTRPFLFTAGAAGPIDLGTLGGNGTSAAAGVNAAGVVVGFADNAAGASRPFRFFDANGNGASDPGEMVDLGTVGGATTGFARAVNNPGQVVGTSGGANAEGSRAFLFTDLNGNGVRDTDVGGRDEMVSLGVLSAGDDRSEAFGVNDAGQVVGYSNAGSSSAARTAFRFTDLNADGAADPGELLALATGTANAINGAGQVVIDGRDASNGRAVLVFTDLDGDNAVGDGEVIELPRLGATSAFGTGINDAGTVVGRLAGGLSTGFVWDAVNGTRDLQALIDPSAGIELRGATGINALGQIAAYGRTADGGTSEFALLLSPVATAVPEPTSAVALAGVAGLLTLRRRRST